eukprot:snap_masked-scaffold_7-processed-gene-5.30-mRNA-1 protein AED:1.00 eAED:1.00 QI:0/0/0/0/1/1/3/0/134
MKGYRLGRTMQYHLCRKMNQIYCFACRCEWTAYYESASRCFDVDEDYKRRVLQDREEWEEHYLENCVLDRFDGLEITDSYSTGSDVPVYSLEESAVNYCNSGFNLMSASLMLVGNFESSQINRSLEREMQPCIL